jgi:hypothetical protein
VGDKRLCLIPDLGEELVEVMNRLNEILLALSQTNEEEPIELAEALVGNEVLPAFERIWGTVRPTQGAIDRPRLLGPDGRYEHVPLAFVRIDEDDLQSLGTTIADLGKEAVRHDEVICETLTELGSGPYGSLKTPTEVVSELARFHGLLDLAWTDDVRVLHERLSVANADVVLTTFEEQAYQRTANRINAMWRLNSGLDRFLY